MKTKKTSSANLETKRLIFFETGILLALSLVLVAFEWSSGKKVKQHMIMEGGPVYVEDLAPITDQNKDNLIPPPPPVIVLAISTDPEGLIDQPELPTFEAKQNEKIRPVQYKEEKPVTDSNYVFKKVEEMPKYHGKPAREFGKFIGQHLQYPVIAAENGIHGIVKVKFIINEQGQLVDAAILRSVDPALDQEALRVVNLSDRWTPGKQRTKPVKVSFVFPIEFNLETR